MTTVFRSAVGDALTREELAQELRVSPKTIRRWERKGMPYLHWGERFKRYVLPDVRGWLDGGGANGDS